MKDESSGTTIKAVNDSHSQQVQSVIVTHRTPLIPTEQEVTRYCKESTIKSILRIDHKIDTQDFLGLSRFLEGITVI